MGKYVFAAALLMLLLSACGASGAPPEAAATDAPAPSQAQGSSAHDDEQATLVAEWRPAYHRASVLIWICFQASETQRAFHQREIDLERALAEQQAEIAYIESVIKATSPSATAGNIVTSYLQRLEDPVSALTEILKSGRDGLGGESFRPVLDACASLAGILKDIKAAAEDAGVGSEGLAQMEAEAYAMKQEVPPIETDRVVTTAPTLPPTVAAQATATKVILVSQLPPKDEWRPAYVQGAVLFETCTMVYQTHADYSQGVIGLDRADSELDVEAEFTEQVQEAIATVSGVGTSAAGDLARIDERATALLEIVQGDEDEIGSPDVMAAIERHCGSLQSRMDAIVTDARAGGLSSSEMSELDAEASPLIDDLYNRTWYGR